MRDTIEMAREAGLLTWLKPPEDVIERLKRFEALVRADERAAHVQEPVAWMHTSGHIQGCNPNWKPVIAHGYTRERGWTPLYTAPPAPVKIGTIGHIDNGKATLTASILSALQATPPAAQRQWVGLTEQEAAECWSTIAVRTWQAIEAKLRSKNT
jgi:hypothetical protein